MALGVGPLVAASLITSTVLRVGGVDPRFVEDATLSNENIGKKLVRLHRLTAAVRISMGAQG